MMKKTWISVAASIVMAGCGSGGGGNTVPPSVLLPALSTASGKVVDGYVSQATVLCDANGNGIADAGEISVITTSQGDFTFPTACTSALVSSGGTNIDTGLPFKGLIKAPSGSLLITPLTSLMVDSGLSAAEVVAALGLPDGTDVTRIDPMSNLELQKKTLVIQQIIQQVTDTLGALASNTSPAALKGLYSAATKAVVATLKATPGTALIGAGGSISNTLVSAIIVDSLNKVAASTDAALLIVKSSLSAYSGASLSELASGAITTQAQTLLQSGDAAALLDNAKKLQANATIAGAAVNFKTLLTVAKEASVDLTNAGISLALLADANGGGNVIANLITAINAEALKAGVPAPVPNVAAWSQPSNALVLQNDSIDLNGKSYTLAQFASGVTLDKKVASLDVISFSYDVKGTPIPADPQGVMTSSVSLGIEIRDVGSKGQVLQFVLDRVDVTLGTDGQLAVAVPANAILYAYGKTSNGTTANITLTNAATDQFIVVANNKLSFNAGRVLNKLTPSQSVFSGLQNITGTFNLKITATNLNIAGQNQGSVKGLSVTVGGSGSGSGVSVTGLGVDGVFTIN